MKYRKEISLSEAPLLDTYAGSDVWKTMSHTQVSEWYTSPLLEDGN